jgi:transcriptional regulator with XRE-family HTH domain
MTTEERATFIRIRLLEVGQTQADIARELGLTRKTVNDTIRRRAGSKKVCEAIAAAIRVPVSKLFPEVYKAKRDVSRGSER